MNFAECVVLVVLIYCAAICLLVLLAAASVSSGHASTDDEDDDDQVEPELTPELAKLDRIEAMLRRHLETPRPCPGPEPGKVRLFCRVPLPIGLESGWAEFELDVPEGLAYRIADLEWMREDAEAGPTP